MTRDKRGTARAPSTVGVSPRPFEPWLSTVLRVLAHGVTAGVLSWPLTVREGVIAAVVGGTIGSLSARYVAQSRVRLPVVVAAFLASLGLVVAARWIVVDLAFLPDSLGPATAMLVGEAAVFGLGALVVSLVLRTISARHPSFSIVEASLIAGGFATLLVAHRNGAIHRPYELADPLISRGEDPTLAILAIGAAGAVVIGLLLLSERSLLRSALHLGVVAALLLAILGTTTMAGLPTPPSTGGALGLQDDDSEGGGGPRGDGGGGGGRRNSDELDFLDQYPSGGGSPDAVVIFHDDYSAPGGYYYFRQNAFSQYNGRKLVATTMAGTDRDVGNSFPTSRARTVAWAPGPDDRATVETTVAMLADNSAPLGLEAPERFIPSTNPNPQRFRRVYRVASIANTAQPRTLLFRATGDLSWSDREREHYTRGPADARYAALAQRIVQELPEGVRELPVAQMYAITQYLSEHGTYSLQSRHAAAEDPTADFLFGDLTGYCVHFAHAAVFLMRAVGLPARVGTGYAVAEANRGGGSALLLRNSDQHAWPEVYVEGAGWIVADVSPQTVLGPQGDPPDPQLQQLLAEMARGATALEDAPQPPRPMAELVRSWAGPFGQGSLGLLLTLVLLGYLNKAWRRYPIGGAPHLVYLAVVDRLSDVGLRRRWGESPESFAARMSASLPSLTPLTDRHLAAAFGRHRSPRTTAQMRQVAQRVKRELGRAVPFWRRLLGALNPFSWLLTR